MYKTVKIRFHHFNTLYAEKFEKPEFTIESCLEDGYSMDDFRNIQDEKERILNLPDNALVHAVGFHDDICAVCTRKDDEKRAAISCIRPDKVRPAEQMLSLFYNYVMNIQVGQNYMFKEIKRSMKNFHDVQWRIEELKKGLYFLDATAYNIRDKLVKERLLAPAVPFHLKPRYDNVDELKEDIMCVLDRKIAERIPDTKLYNRLKKYRIDEEIIISVLQNLLETGKRTRTRNYNLALEKQYIVEDVGLNPDELTFGYYSRYKTLACAKRWIGNKDLKANGANMYLKRAVADRLRAKTNKKS